MSHRALVPSPEWMLVTRSSHCCSWLARHTEASVEVLTCKQALRPDMVPMDRACVHHSSPGSEGLATCNRLIQDSFA